MLQRFLRFRLWHLLFLITFVACLTGWYARASRVRAAELAAIDYLDEVLPGYIATLKEDDILWCGTGLSGTADQRWAGPIGMPKAWRKSSWADVFYRIESLTIHGYYMNDVVDDRAVDPLLKLQHLRELDIYEARISPENIERLRRGLPDTTIEIHESEVDDDQDLSAYADEIEPTIEWRQSQPEAAGNPFGSPDADNPFDF